MNEAKPEPTKTAQAKQIIGKVADEGRTALAAATNGERRGSRLGWVGLGLGLAEVVAPGAVARAIGLANDPWERTVVRIVGLRCLTVGLGSLRKSRPSAWRWARLAGGLIDLGLLGLAFRNPPRRVRRRLRRRVPVALGVMAGLALIDAVNGVRAGVHARKTRTLQANTSPAAVDA